MIIPDKIMIGAHEIPVRKCAPIDCETGKYTFREQSITVSTGPDRPEDSVAEILMHEIMECIADKYNLTHDNHIDHTGITVMSEQLFAAIRLNGLDFRRPE